MKRAAFDALVSRIEKSYAGRQAALERATSRWIALGLAALLSWLVFLTSVGLLFFVLGAITEPPLGIVLICIGVPVALYGALQAYYLMHDELTPPEGHLVGPGEAPAPPVAAGRLTPGLAMPVVRPGAHHAQLECIGARAAPSGSSGLAAYDPGDRPSAGGGHVAGRAQSDSGA